MLMARSLDLVVSLPYGPATLDADHRQLERLVLNLLSNAVKFTPDPGRVEVAVTNLGAAVQVRVADTGYGIAEEDQAKLFTRFFRSAAAVEHAVQGTGLGLAVSRAIVTAHEGDIAVTSREGFGTTVTVTLPRPACLADPAVEPGHAGPQAGWKTPPSRTGTASLPSTSAATATSPG